MRLNLSRLATILSRGMLKGDENEGQESEGTCSDGDSSDSSVSAGDERGHAEDVDV